MIGLRKILILVALVTGLWFLGVVGYMYIEGWDFLDAFYMTAITLSTVGYEEVHPLTAPGRFFTALFIVLGVGSFFYGFGVLVDAFIEGHIKGFLERRKMDKIIKSLHSHYIICGYGRIGRTIARTLGERGMEVVVVENDPATIEEVKADGFYWVEGDATRDEVLKDANVERAKGIVCVLKSDSDNVYITITARWLNPGLLIVARASDQRAETKMVQAGADQVISPYEIGARRMALAIIQPTVTEFLDLAVHSARFDLKIEQIEVKEGSPIIAKSFRDAGLRQRFGVTILAVQDPKDNIILTPDPDFKVNANHVLIALGPAKGLERLRGVAEGMESV